MLTNEDIQEFMKLKTIAIIGVSRSEKKFPYQLYKTLKNKGYNVLSVNPYTTSISGETCYNSIAAIPQKVDGVVLVVPRKQTLSVIKEAIAAGIKYVWIQQGAETQEAIAYCAQNGLKVIHHHCILMFAEPSSFPHNLHRGIWKMLGKLPN